MKRILFWSFMVLTKSAVADQTGCSMTPLEVNAYATRLVKTSYDTKTNLDLSMIGHDAAEIHLSNHDGNHFYYNGEGFIRPNQNGRFVVNKALFITVSLRADNNAVYVCAHSEADTSKNHLTIYFLQGHGLARNGIRNNLGNLFFPIELKITPLTFSVLGFGAGLDAIGEILNNIPILDVIASLPAEVLTDLQSKIAASLGKFAGVGVERIIVRPASIEVAAHVDLAHPEKAQIMTVIPLPESVKKSLSD